MQSGPAAAAVAFYTRLSEAGVTVGTAYADIGDLKTNDIVENGHDVQFTFTENDGTWFVSGAFTGNGDTMSDEVTFPVRFSSGIQEFNGSWTATRG